MKHDRFAEFRLASLDNVVHALGALFLILAGFRLFPGMSHVHHADLVEYIYSDIPFTVQVAGDWPPRVGVTS